MLLHGGVPQDSGVPSTDIAEDELTGGITADQILDDLVLDGSGKGDTKAQGGGEQVHGLAQMPGVHHQHPVGPADRVLPLAAFNGAGVDQQRARGSDPLLAGGKLDELKKQASIPGTAWAVDPSTGQIVITADRTVTGESGTRCWPL